MFCALIGWRRRDSWAVCQTRLASKRSGRPHNEIMMTIWLNCGARWTAATFPPLTQCSGLSVSDWFAAAARETLEEDLQMWNFSTFQRWVQRKKLPVPLSQDSFSFSLNFRFTAAAFGLNATFNVQTELLSVNLCSICHNSS